MSDPRRANPMRLRRVLLIGGVALGVLVIAVVGWLLFGEPPGDPRLAPFVRGKPPVPVVFTSRTEPASFRAGTSAAIVADSFRPVVFRGDGQPQWQAREGRLRVLTPSGRVRELTWDKKLPDGGTLIDVQSPSVTADGKTVVFAGRRADADGGRFRIYSVNLDGTELRPLTGGADDPGCVAVPPLRFAADGSPLPDDARKQLDYDDTDPVLLPNGALVFASSRLPDLGGRDRRATQIWVQEPGKPARTLTANRANDRWPAITVDHFLMFSVWSKQDEVISADGTGLVRHDPPKAGLTAPSDRWMAARITPAAEQFAIGVKVPEPVWRPRTLCDGRVAFMTPAPGRPTPFTAANEYPEAGPLRVAAAPLGQLSSSPSSLAAGTTFPESSEPGLRWAPALTPDGRRWSLATPSPLPADRVLVAAAPLGPDGTPTPADYGLYTLPQNGWTTDPNASGELTPLFDDPELVDAEPVGVYPRPIENVPIRPPQAWEPAAAKKFDLLTGAYSGPAGELHVAQITTVATGPIPGNLASGGGGPIVPIFPTGKITKIAFLASGRDRFDDPVRPVVRGTLEKVHEVNVDGSGAIRTTMPVGSPTLLIGLGPDGKVASAVGAADAKGNRGTFYAFAGDHVSGTRPGGYHFCTGCHAGHTFPGAGSGERAK